MKDLVCPHCGSELSLDYVNDGGSYSEHRSVDTIECDNWDTCAAEWDRNFKAVKPSKLEPTE